MSTSSTEPTAFEGDGRSQVILRNRKILVVCHKDELEDLSAKDFIELFTREVVEDAPGTAFTASALVDKFIKQGMWVGGVCITVLRYAFMFILSAVLFQGLRALIRAEITILILRPDETGEQLDASSRAVNDLDGCVFAVHLSSGLLHKGFHPGHACASQDDHVRAHR